MFYSIPNLSAQAVTPMERPWEYVPAADLPYDDKRVFLKWSQDLATKHSFVCAIEGISPEVRTHSTTNRPFKMHALIADYDAPLPPDASNWLMSKPQSEFKPSWLIQTISGNSRLVWMFERPIPILSDEHFKNFIRRITKELKLNKWLAGLDTAALGTSTRYYEHGSAWINLPNGEPILKGFLQRWAFDACLECHLNTSDTTTKIPMEIVAADVAKLYPGRWKGEFRLGAQGVRFWDPVADNPTGAWVREDGIFCFTGGQQFVPWAQILSKEVIAEYSSKSMDKLLDGTAYDGRMFWCMDDNAYWKAVSKDDFSQRLRVDGWGGKGRRGEVSPLDKVEVQLKKQRLVEAAFPFMFFRPGIIQYKNKTYLNISRTRCLAPAAPLTPERMTWEEGEILFPFIHKLFATMFINPGDNDHQKQLTAFLAWLKYFYVNSLNLTPRQGQAIVLAGPPGKGKSFLTEMILGELLGGRKDATSHLVEGDQWTADLADAPIMAIEDSVGAADYRSLTKFSAKLKKYAANPEILFNQKFKDSGSVPWFGRPVITCNLDSESMRIIPNMDISIKDKVSLFKTSDHLIDFSDRDTNAKYVRQELPNFARFLVDWVIPAEWIAPEMRYGVRPFHHPELMAEARQQGLGVIIEVLQAYFEAYSANRKDEKHWKGRATDLHNDLHVFNPAVMREITARSLATQLGLLAKNGYGVYRTDSSMAGSYNWRINFDLVADVMKETKL